MILSRSASAIPSMPDLTMSLNDPSPREGLPSGNPGQAGVHDVLVLGAGPAGLSIGYELKQRGLKFLLLERGQTAGESWRRMPVSLKLVTPWRTNALPGTCPGLFVPQYEMTRQEYFRYLRDYAAEHQLPVQFGEAVTRVARDSDGLFRVTTSAASYRSKLLVNATGSFSKPFVPGFDGAADSPIPQLHVAEYGDPERLRALVGDRTGPVLIVGKRLSAGQTLVELVEAGFEVALSHRSKIRFGSGPFGRWLFLRIFPELEALKIRVWGQNACGFDVPMEGGAARRLIRSGTVKTFPDVNRFQGASILFKDGTRLKPAAVVYATGFRPALDHLHELLVTVPDRRRLPPLNGMESVVVPGLFFLGLEHQRNMQSQYLRGIRKDAALLAGELSGLLRRT
jgi:putative flavoprotein involved in K+ transport